MIIVPALPIHFQNLDLQDAQMFVNKYVQDEQYIKQLCETGYAWAGVIDDKTIFIAGVFEPHEHIGMVWALLGREANENMISVTRSISRWLENWDCDRLETAVANDFKQGHRWAEMLGFINETPNGMKNYGIDGKTYNLYARTK